MIHETSYRRRFLVPDKEGMIIVPVDSIRFITSEAGLSRIFTSEKRVYTLGRSLEEMGRGLDPERFMRVTHHHIVNVDAIERLTNWFNRKTKVQVADWPDAEIYVIKERLPELRRWLDR